MILTEEQILQDEEKLEEVFECLRNGGVIIYPTETVYGLGGALSSNNATEKIFALKTRESSLALLSIAYDLRQAESFARFRFELEYDLFHRFGEKGMTVLLDARPFVSSRVRGGTTTLGIRLASTELCKLFTEKLAEPITSTMASLSNRLTPDIQAGEVIPRKLTDVPASLIAQVDFAIDGGTLSDSLPSTLVRVESENRIILYREGVVVKKDLEESFGVEVDDTQESR